MDRKNRKNAPSPTVLVDSIASSPTPKWLTAVGIIIGTVLGYRAFVSFGQTGMNGRFLFNAFMCLICVYGSRISRKLYLSDIGVVREMGGWGRTPRRVLPWSGVQSVSFAFRADKMMAFFEAGSMGWKVPFLKSQERAVRDVLDRMLPEIEINVIERH